MPIVSVILLSVTVALMVVNNKNMCYYREGGGCNLPLSSVVWLCIAIPNQTQLQHSEVFSPDHLGLIGVSPLPDTPS